MSTQTTATVEPRLLGVANNLGERAPAWGEPVDYPCLFTEAENFYSVIDGSINSEQIAKIRIQRRLEIPADSRITINGDEYYATSKGKVYAHKYAGRTTTVVEISKQGL